MARQAISPERRNVGVKFADIERRKCRIRRSQVRWFARS